MKRIKTFYWIFTGLMLLLMLFSGISGLAIPDQSNRLIVGHLGYPQYFVPLISLAKVVGAVVILVPGFPRVKEWVYAGFVFDLGMAAYSCIAVGDPIANTWFILLGLVLIFGSYIFYHRKLKLASGTNEAPVAGGPVAELSEAL
jgi:hypothetical protein